MKNICENDLKLYGDCSMDELDESNSVLSKEQQVIGSVIAGMHDASDDFDMEA